MKLVCINCPRGCHLEANKNGDEIIVTGNTCERGKQYAINELTNPLRTLTTTVAIESELYDRLPVITSKPVPKLEIMNVMKKLKDVKINPPINMGDIIISNINDLDVNIIASKSILK